MSEKILNETKIAYEHDIGILQSGSQILLHLKEEAQDFLEEDTVKQLIKKYMCVDLHVDIEDG
jgi:HSP90 family molecular chaperone